MGRVLVVDDEPSICWGFRELLTDEGHSVETASSAEEALERAQEVRPDAVVLDVRLPGMDGLSAIRHLRERIGKDRPIVVITAFGDLRTAVDAMQQGAFDYLTKPFDLDRAAEVVRRALDVVPQESDVLVPQLREGDSLVGSAPLMQKVFKQIALAAGADVPVLITGESGTGKELVARAIHFHSARSAGPFVPICPAALSPTVIESELFGHVRGAFTGADRDRTGLLELAAGGTVLLDEIGDLPVALQVKLLRAVEQREVTCVGGAEVRPTDFRIVAATHRPLAEMIQRGEFREDLFYRLSVFQIELPSLRQRPEDIPQLAEHFLRDLGPLYRSRRFAEATILELQSRSWPGNVRELKNAVEHAAIVARSDVIEPEHLPAESIRKLPIETAPEDRLQRDLSLWANGYVTATASPDVEENLYDAFLRMAEPPLLQWALAHCRQNRTAAAKLLGLNRATLRDKLRRHGIDDASEP